MEDNNQFEARDESPKKEFKDISTESSKTEFSDTNFDTENVSSAPPCIRQTKFDPPRRSDFDPLRRLT